MRLPLSFLAVLFFAVGASAQSADHCDACGELISGKFYTTDDAATGEKKRICRECAAAKRCFLCGMPARVKGLDLPDGRIICQRDQRDLVTSDEEARAVARETSNRLNREFSRFMTFPEKNVAVSIVDREHLAALFKSPGRDTACPNIWGCMITTRTNGELAHEVSLLSGLQRPGLQSTFAHEITHAWLNANLSSSRKSSLNRDSIEGFCELIAHKLMTALGEEQQLKQILANKYTRGQTALFIEADRQYGLSDVMDWMISGADVTLEQEKLGRVRALATPNLVDPPVSAFVPGAIAPPDDRPTQPANALGLKAVFLGPRPTALINNRTFEVGDERTIRLGSSNVVIRCLEIRTNSVLIREAGATTPRVLTLRAR